MTSKRMKKLAFAMAAAGLATHQAWAIQSYPGDPGMIGSPASWRTAEFLRDWGLRAMGAEYAYAAGVSGMGIKVGEVDSGYDASHPEFAASRYQGVLVGTIPGAYNGAYNDRHGTHVAGTIAANRDGGGAVENMHGVAFNANLFVANTAKTDSANFGRPVPGQSATITVDDQHIADAYRQANAQGVRIISTSWGSPPTGEQYNTLAQLHTANGYYVANNTWIQGAFDAAKTGTLMVFSAGNGGWLNPSPRAAAPYFDPKLESNWLAVSALRTTGQTFNDDGSVNVPGTQNYNKCGVAKWSCVTAPGVAINGTVLGGAYASLNGTSMAAPHASGALALIMERFGYMTNEQVLTVLKTTATQNATIADAAGTGTVANPEAGQQVKVPDVVNGWGTPSLRRAMNGPGQFIGPFAVNTQGQNDTWSNDISDIAIRARRAEDAAEAAAWEATRQSRGWTTGLPPGASDADRSEYATGTAREAARATRVYAGSLEKLGAGTLTLSGQNSYTGSTAVNGGTLKAGATNAFSGASAHTVGAGGTLDLAGFSQKLPSLANGGIVSLVGTAPGTTLTITGAYVGNNGTLRLGTALGDSGSASDRLVLAGAGASASGRTTLQVTNLGGLGALTSGSGIELVSALNGATTTAQSSKDAFTLANGHVDAGAYEYRLHAADANGAGENWYLRSAVQVGPGPVLQIPTYRVEVPMLAALPEQLRQGNLAMLGSSRVRMGDDDAGIGRNDAGDALDGPRRSAWGRVVGTSLKTRQQGTVSPAAEGRLTGLQAGTDLWADRSWRAGVYVGRLEGDARVGGFARGVPGLAVGSTDLRSEYLGAYGTFTNDTGFYADAVLQGGRHRYTAGPFDGSPSASGKGNSTMLSLEVGQSFAMGGDWKIEPQLQLVHQRLKLGDVNLFGARVAQDADSGWTVRAGLRLKGRIATDAGVLQPYARLNVYRSSSGTDAARFIGPAGSTDIVTRTGGTSTEVAAGATLSVGERTSLYAEVGKLFASGGDSRVRSGINASLGVRVKW
ncbi:autotransporter outer membrane beta-barrel domain-containing protein [Variovorax sp. NFACC27]|uniref:autotransporter outer membrane beta-barrel domain-containing protein n=1 Tax=unclassified Variovorax TaxID=663243 RepID=UPI000896F863|nr:subtilase-type serine protease [Variovorax sp. NFACC28]SEG06789.1 subtilase-type serine protease [Variovorax sp. NFACC29]SFC01238.1 subtilase-type serine protease [Variovorax sp. NFACC26]SFF78529.1 subtilase-type serine protease [Variovorax sp. NFACC27]